MFRRAGDMSAGHAYAARARSLPAVSWTTTGVVVESIGASVLIFIGAVHFRELLEMGLDEIADAPDDPPRRHVDVAGLTVTGSAGGAHPLCGHLLTRADPSCVPERERERERDTRPLRPASTSVEAAPCSGTVSHSAVPKGST
jgi:hypothetical protein